MTAVGMGIDVGRTRDSTVICTVEVVQSGEAFVRHVTVLRDTPFRDQWARIQAEVTRFRPKAICIDGNAIGATLAEELQRRYGEAVVDVYRTHGDKTAVVGVAYDLFTSGKVRVPQRYRQVVEEFSNIRRVVNESGTVTYRDDPHGDLAWATGMAFHAATRGIEMGFADARVLMALEGFGPDEYAPQKACVECGAVQARDGTPAMSGDMVGGYRCGSHLRKEEAKGGEG